MLACEQGRAETVKLLLAAKVDMNKQDRTVSDACTMGVTFGAEG
jgi:hypothetical protein